MKIYILTHDTLFLESQIESIRTHMPDATVAIAASVLSSKSLLSHPGEIVRTSGNTTFTMLRSLLPQADDGPSAFIEWDMVLTKPIPVRNAVNKEPDVDFEQYHPSFLSYESKRDLDSSFLVSQISRPFIGDFATVRQDWIRGGCEEKSFFRSLDNGILHFHNKAAFRTFDTMAPARVKCWNRLMKRHGLPGVTVSKPGLGDMVAAGLDAIGITKDRVEAIVGGPCGCPQRQAALNAAGAKYLGLSPGSTASTNQP